MRKARVGSSRDKGRRRPLWQAALLHALLVIFSSIFLLPLFWLVASSLKSDDQIRAFPPEWIPDIPYCSEKSPYFDAHEYGELTRPEICPEEAWATLPGRLTDRAKGLIDIPYLWDVEAEALCIATAQEIASAIPEAIYQSRDEAVIDDAILRLGAGAYKKALETAYRQLALGGLSFQQEATASQGVSQTLGGVAWYSTTEGVQPAVEEVAGQDATSIAYGMSSETELRADVDWTPDVSGFRNLTINLHGDRSWRKVGVLLQTPEGAYRTDRPILLSSAIWEDVMLIRDPDGEIPWGTYRLLESADAPSEAGTASLTLTVLTAAKWQVIARKLTYNYPAGLTFIPFGKYLMNTLLVCGLVVFGTLISCSLVAYGLARVRWRGRNVLFYIIIGTMMLPFQVTMVPMFVVFAKIGWVDSFLPLFVPAFFGNAFFIFLLRQFFMTIPHELTDAARVDGCSEFGIYWKIIMPLAKPALATVGLFAFMNTWNDYVGPLIYLSDASKYTLSIGLASFSSQYGSYPGMLMAVTAVMTVPIIILFFLAQRTFIQGITLTGVKG